MLKKKYLVVGDEPIVPKKTLLVRLIKVVHIRPMCKQGWSCLLHDAMFEMLLEFVESAATSPIVFQWIAQIKQMPIVLPRDHKLVALKTDCSMLHCCFPLPDVDVQPPHVLQFKEVRENLIDQAVDYLTKKRALLKWKKAPKLVDFDAAFADYKEWKREQKPITLQKSTENLVQEYKKRGMTVRSAREAVCLGSRIFLFCNVCLCLLRLNSAMLLCRLVCQRCGKTPLMRVIMRLALQNGVCCVRGVMKRDPRENQRILLQLVQHRMNQWGGMNGMKQWTGMKSQYRRNHRK